MSLQNGKNIAIVGAGNQTTGLAILNTVNVAASAATTISLRKTSGAGTIVAQVVLAAAGPWSLNFGDGLLCDTGVWFIESTAGNITGGVTGTPAT